MTDKYRMSENETKRLSRLTAIVTQLQTKRILTSTELADKFSVSVRTIYRDIRALEQAGVSIITEEGIELLSDDAPRKSEETEALMKKESAFNQMQLPALDE